MKNAIRNTLSILVTLAVFGCATVGRKIDQDAVAQIEKGKTTKAEVRQLIGAPDQVMKDSDGNETWTYMYIRSVAKGESFIPIYGAFGGGAKTQNQSTIVQFGADGVVKSIATSYGGMDVDTGVQAGGKARIEDTEEGKREK